MTPPGIEPATFRFVAQHFKHCATAHLMRMKCYLKNRRLIENNGKFVVKRNMLEEHVVDERMNVAQDSAYLFWILCIRY